MDVRIETAGSDDCSVWQAYVDRMPAAGAMHHWGWFHVLGEAFAVERCFFIARLGTEICGVLPAYVSAGAFVSRHVSSLEDGLLADSPEIAGLLVRRLIAQRDASRARYALVRGLAAVGELPVVPSVVRPTFRRCVPTATPLGLLWQGLDRRVRREIRRARESGYTVVRDENLEHLDGTFYDLYAASVHALGTPVMSRDLMTAMRMRLREHTQLYLAHAASGEIVGGIVGLTSSSGFAGMYGCMREDARLKFANYLLYWQIIEASANAGQAYFDLGRSHVGSGPALFKAKWPGEDRPANHVVFAAHGTSAGALGRPDGGDLRQRLWRRLPLGVANVLGPIVRRHIPLG